MAHVMLAILTLYKNDFTTKNDPTTETPYASFDLQPTILTFTARDTY